MGAISAATRRSRANTSHKWIQAVCISAKSPSKLRGQPIPIIARMIVERLRAATIIMCRFVTLASPRDHVRLAPPVLQTRAKDLAVSSLRSRDSFLPRSLCVRFRAFDQLNEGVLRQQAVECRVARMAGRFRQSEATTKASSWRSRRRFPSAMPLLGLPPIKPSPMAAV